MSTRPPRHAETTAGRQDAAAPSKERKCLCCNRPFLSQGAHNRLCTPCRGKTVSPYAL